MHQVSHWVAPMIATITVQHPQGRSPHSNLRYMRDSNSAGEPLPIIPRRTTRSHSLPTSQISSRQHLVPTSYHQWSQSFYDSDSGSSSSSDASESMTRIRRKRVKDVRPGVLNPPKIPSSPTKKPADSLGQVWQPQGGQGILSAKSDENVPIIAAPRPLMYTPGTLRLSLETIRSHMLANPHPHLHDPRTAPGGGSKSAPPPENNANQGSRLVIRKKSGQPVKSSLKTSRSSTRGNLSVVTIGSSSKSEPPTPKAVHFDSKLEHVKLFLAEQKPLAVSRDGSPTEDTSGTDSDFPSFIYGDDDTRRSRKKLVMRPANMPSKRSLDADVVLEDFYLNFDGTNILGKIRVRNIAYAKTVAVRFTFDSWQTTSEVTGRYAESIDSQFDRFSFSIRLDDLLARIEGKTFMMAVRYNVAGQEFWDNNGQQDYVATFTKAKVSRESRKSDDEDASDVENLRSKLEQVILQGKEKSSAPTCSQKLTASQFKETDPPSLKSSVSLASRYDFATSLRNPNAWKPSDVPARASPPKDARMPPRPTARARSSTSPDLPSSSIPWPEKMSPTKRPARLPVTTPLLTEQPLLGSPRDIDEERLLSASHRPVSKLDSDASNVSSSGSARGRNHHRGYFETGSVAANSSVRRTPPGSPSKSSEFDLPSLSVPPITSLPPTSRYHSFPPLTSTDGPLSSSIPLSFELDTSTGTHQLLSPSTASHDSPRSLSLGLGESSGESDLSTPSLASPTSSRSPTPSPTDPFMKPSLPPLSDDGFGPVSGLSMLHATQPVSPGTHYRQFLSK